MPEPKQHTAPSTLLFDLDGTLVDSAVDLATAVNLLRQEHELLPLSIDTVRNYVGDGATMLIRRAMPQGQFRVEQIHRFLELYAHHLVEETHPYPGIVDFLEQRKHLKMAVVTNKPEELSRRLLDRLNLSRYFGVVIGGDTFDRKKPSAKPLLAAVEQLGTISAETAMIGDHHTDLHAGANAGIATCFCAWGLGNIGDADYTWRAETVTELEQLFPVIE
jgi:phosphoglycolate phosphatase